MQQVFRTSQRLIVAWTRTLSFVTILLSYQLLIDMADKAIHDSHEALADTKSSLGKLCSSLILLNLGKVLLEI